MFLFLCLCAFAVDVAFPYSWRGIPYGPIGVLVNPPGNNATCRKNPDPGAAWSCVESIGEMSYVVTYMREGEYFTGVYISCAGPASCANLFLIVNEAWAKSQNTPVTPLQEVSGRWFVEDCAGQYEYRKETERGSVVLSNLIVYQEAEEKKKEREAAERTKAANEL